MDAFTNAEFLSKYILVLLFAITICLPAVLAGPWGGRKRVSGQ